MKYGRKEVKFLFCIFCNPDFDFMLSPSQINITFNVDRDILCLLITWRRIQISARQGNAFLAPRRTLSFSANWMQKNLHKIMHIIISVIHFNLTICLIKSQGSRCPIIRQGSTSFFEWLNDIQDKVWAHTAPFFMCG